MSDLAIYRAQLIDVFQWRTRNMLRHARNRITHELTKLALDGYKPVGPIQTQIIAGRLVKTVKVVGPDANPRHLAPAVWGLVAKPDYDPEDDQ